MSVGLDLWLVKSVRADMVKGRVNVVLEGPLNDRVRGAEEELRHMAKFEQAVDVTIIRRQQGLPLMRLEEARVASSARAADSQYVEGEAGE